ncbi:posterior protein-like [Engystomops pustulosus]|uniref:posterior protein-like n=1 Tax=Engystomops pustulosus TaxID=76066 RepID=UPI003AFB65E4
MEVVRKFFKKCTSACYVTSADDDTSYQFNDLTKQSNEKGSNRRSGVKVKLVSKFVSKLMKRKNIKNQEKLQCQSEKVQIREEQREIQPSVNVVIANVVKEKCEYLRDQGDVVQQNCDLGDKLEEYDTSCRLKEQHVVSIVEERHRDYEYDAVIKDQLHDANLQLLQKEQCTVNVSLAVKENHRESYCGDEACRSDDQENTERKWGVEQPPPKRISSLFTPVSEENRRRTAILNLNSGDLLQSGTMSIPIKTNLCQVTSISPSNKLESVVPQYSLNNRDERALLWEWLQSQSGSKLQPPRETPTGLPAEMNLANDDDRVKEMHRGSKAPDNTKLKREDDLINVCSSYLTLYTAIYKCLDMSQGESNFANFMTDKFTFVDCPTKVSLRNASSYQTFVNSLEDWSQQTSQYIKIQEKLFKCANTGHTIKGCKKRGEEESPHRKDKYWLKNYPAPEGTQAFIKGCKPAETRVKAVVIPGNDQFDMGAGTAKSRGIQAWFFFMKMRISTLAVERRIHLVVLNSALRAHLSQAGEHLQGIEVIVSNFPTKKLNREDPFCEVSTDNLPPCHLPVLCASSIGGGN